MLLAKAGRVCQTVTLVTRLMHQTSSSLLGQSTVAYHFRPLFSQAVTFSRICPVSTPLPCTPCTLCGQPQIVTASKAVQLAAQSQKHGVAHTMQISSIAARAHIQGSAHHSMPLHALPGGALRRPAAAQLSSIQPPLQIQEQASSRRLVRRSAVSTQQETAVHKAASPSAPATNLPPLQLYNSMSRKKEAFTPRDGQGNKVSLYVCGVTVYDLSHIGHGRVYSVFDVFYRYLQHIGYDVFYVRNFTDVDDKIIKRAQESGVEPSELSQRFIGEFHRDIAALGCLPPVLEPRATDHIRGMIDMIQRIISHGHGYTIDGDVYFDVGSIEGYGRLSGRKEEDNRAGERVAVDSRKRNAADFALWKAAKPGEPTWDSPWGPGRPGWHIECSAMIRELMGPVIDIHGGGRDLLFPHHTNELVQTQASASPCDRDCMHNGIDFVRFWVHNGFVNVDAEKMSKSLGNFFTIRDVLQQYHPLALRWFLIGTQYRQGINYTQRALEEASDRTYFIYQALLDVQGALAAAGPEGSAPQQAARSQMQAGQGPGSDMMAAVYEGMSDDLNTPIAMSALSGPLKTVNELIHTKKGKKAAGRLDTLASLQLGLQTALGLLGLDTDDPAKTLDEMRALALVRAGVTEADINEAFEQRAAARKAKDYAAGDALRQRFADKGILMMDTPTGAAWRPGPRLDIASQGEA